MRIIGNDTSIPRQTVKVASGTVTSGSPVIVNADGTVSSVATSSVSQSNGSELELINDGNNGVTQHKIVYNPHHKVCLAVYRKYDGYLYGCRVSVTNGTTISKGTEHVLYAGHQVRGGTVNLIYDAYSKCWVLGWTKETSSHDYRYVRAIKYNEAANDIFVNTGIFNYNSDPSHMYKIASNDKGQIVSVYENSSNGNGYAQAKGINPDGTFSGTGTAVNFHAYNPTEGITLAYEPNCDRFVVFYNAFGSGSKRCRAFRVSGTTISVADHYSSEFDSSAGSTGENHADAVYDPVHKCIVYTYVSANTARGAVVEVIRKTSGSDDTWGSVVIDSNSNVANNNWGSVITHHASCFDKSTGKVVLVYPWGGSSAGGGLPYQMMYKEGSVANLNSTSDQAQIMMSWSEDQNTHTGFVSNYQNNVIPELTYDEENKCVVFIYGGNFQQNATNHPATVKAYIFASTQTNLTSGNYIGIAKNSASNGENVTVSTQGSIATNLSGLTVGKEHYIQNNGTLSTTVADPSVIAGTALSATSLLVKG
jgi:hypothetical protein